MKHLVCQALFKVLYIYYLAYFIEVLGEEYYYSPQFTGRLSLAQSYRAGLWRSLDWNQAIQFYTLPMHTASQAWSGF